MKTSRNDPCPCGSGRKYKACCKARDDAREHTVRVFGAEAVAELEARTNGAARRAAFWEADVVPLPGRMPDTGVPGALVIVGAEDYILTGEVLGRRPAGAQARAQAILTAVMTAGRGAGVLPERLRVRDDTLAAALAADAGRRGIAVEAGPLSRLDEAIQGSLAHITGSAAGAIGSVLWSWAESEASPAELAEFHAAAAEYHRVAPWRTVGEADPLLLAFPDEEGVWAASVMGRMGLHEGLALYSDPLDLVAMMQGPLDADAFAGGMRGVSVSLGYERPAELSRPMRREVMAAGWELARPDACPTLMGVCIPGRRITAEHVCRAALACRAVTAFIRADPEVLPWRHPESGITVDFMYDDDEDVDGAAGVPWPVPETAKPVGPAGPAADPGAVLRLSAAEVGEAEQARLLRFGAWLVEQKLSRAAAMRTARAARMWGQMLVDTATPAEAVTEYDLLLFLYLYVGHLEKTTKMAARYLTRSLHRVFQFLALREGIEYPWAARVLADLDVLAADADDVREVLLDAGHAVPRYLLLRGLLPVRDVPGTENGWLEEDDDRLEALKLELQRRWLIWYDELVHGGTTDHGELVYALVIRQREWENTPHPRLDGRTPREVLMEEGASRV